MCVVPVRDARPEDWPRVKDLLAELGRPDVREDPDEPRHREAFERYLERDDALALVAEETGEIVGFVDVEFRRRLISSTCRHGCPTSSSRRARAGRARDARCSKRPSVARESAAAGG
jgi:hypothetical protein